VRIEKQNDGWWILDVPPYSVNGAVYTTCGPYDTKAEAVDDKRGLEAFYRQNPELNAVTLVAQDGTTLGGAYSGHWFVKSLAFKPRRLSSVKQPRSSPGQKLLPGIDQ
jgi:hypothetical protein